MPRLSDLLSDKLKKQLLAETRRRPAHEDKKQHAHQPAAVPTSAARVSVPAVPIPDFVAIDVETTGLDFATDRIIEIGAVRFTKGKPDGEYCSFVNPGAAIPAVITELTGITDADVAPAPSFAGCVRQLLAFLENRPLCGHQIDFDRTFINKELERAGMQPLSVPLLDTVLLSKLLLQSATRFSLKSVSASLEVTLDNAHRALADARASGEVAVLLVPKIALLPLYIRQTMAAAAPASFLKSLIIQTLNGVHPKVSVRTPATQAESSALQQKLSTPETFRTIDVNGVKAVFSEGGGLATAMPSFTVRKSQQDMATEVAEAFNTSSILVAEAGTGTGKTMAYLVPAAQWSIVNNTRVVVATRTKNLQDQLLSKELPLVAGIMGGTTLRYSVLKGRSNYLCLNRWERLLRGEAGNLSVRERFALLPLIPWVESTTTGDIEEQNQFNPRWFQKVWDLISADSQGSGRRGCEGKRCRFFKSCFFQQARQKAQTSHIVVINHALFFSEMGSAGSFLGTINAIIFDEAHNLEDGGHRHLRVELDTNRISLYLEGLNNLVHRISESQETIGREIKAQVKSVRKHAMAFLDSLQVWAKTRNSEAPQAEYQIPLHADDLASNIEAPAFANTLDAVKDLLYRLKQEIPALLPPKAPLHDVKDEVAECQERTSQLAADLGYLVAAQTDDHAFWIEGNFVKGWTKLCGVPLDVAGLLSALWAECRGAIVFTSATLSVARSTDYFFNSVGLEPHKARTAVRFFPSVFTRQQAIMGALKNAPDPDTAEFSSAIAAVVAKLHGTFGKNILALFTSNALLGDVYKRLKADTRIGRQNILAQNISGGRHALLEQFKQQERMILLGTDSFWEGIDVPGEACEIVVITRLPFPVPTHPLTVAIAEKMARLHGESFMSYAVPEAVIRFRQGCGRLIRTATDRGALVVLDNRIITRGYGKQFIRSLDGNFRTFDTEDSMLSHLTDFFNGVPDEQSVSTVSYVPFDEV